MLNVFLSHSTVNIGDDIQTLALIRYLGITGYGLVDRDNLWDMDEEVHLHIAGWFLWGNQFPPKERVFPTYYSLHITPEALPIMTSKESIAHFKKFEPIGCRDWWTYNILKGFGVKVKMNSCITLTLQSRTIKKEGRLEIAHEAHRVDPKMDPHDRLKLAGSLIRKYDEAETVICSRLHAALHAKALGAKVIFNPKDKNDVRFTGYEYLLV